MNIFFDESAIVFHYSDTDDDLSNFIKFNESFFNDSLVIFVDDVLHTLSTFNSIDNYLKSLPNFKFKDTKSSIFDYSICLINRLGYYDEELIKKIIPKGNFLPIYKINLPPIINPNNEFPYISRENKFKKISETCVLDKMKLHALEVLERVKPYDTGKEAKEPEFNINDFF